MQFLICIQIKALGIDGLNSAFFQHYWDILGQDVSQACRRWIRERSFPQELNETILVLILKVRNPQVLSNFRPIALCNILYKIMSKMLDRRLRSIINKLISDNQSAFVPRHHNIIVAAEIMHFLKMKTQGKHEMAALKIDICKAYDRLEWSFINSMLLALGFPIEWAQMIMFCITTE